MTTLELCDADLKQALALVYQHTGVRMSAKKRALIHGRLERRLRAREISEWSDYWDLIESDRGELDQFIDLVTTHETYFHRTPRVWSYFASEFLPEFWRREPSRPLRIWSAACSTGEEAYTLAMYGEEFRRTHGGFQFSVLATDISAGVLAMAEAGRYQGRTLEALSKASPGFLRNYLRPVDEEVMEVAPTIRANITFRQHNLLRQGTPRERFDIALLRNVLIYFDQTDQESVVEAVRRSLNPGGILVIGESESLARLDTRMEFIQPLVYTSKGSD